LVIVDHRGRAIFCNNVADGEKAEMMDGPMEPGRGRWLISLPSSGSEADLARALPAHLRSCHITPLKLDGDLRGAALVFPDDDGTETPRPFRTGPVRKFRER
jgi:sigma-54 dependent transcriptional regulator, acetoin dehydrogenase operon transcriptional activator AcoR